jgi:quinol monooxygenase YgiN
MTSINASDTFVTFINVFVVEPRHQGRVLELLEQVTAEHVKQEPGFVSCALHRALDGTKVTMYAQWRSIEAYEAMRKNPGPLPAFQEILSIATFDSSMYEVVQTFDAA